MVHKKRGLKRRKEFTETLIPKKYLKGYKIAAERQGLDFRRLLPFLKKYHSELSLSKLDKETQNLLRAFINAKATAKHIEFAELKQEAIAEKLKKRAKKEKARKKKLKKKTKKISDSDRIVNHVLGSSNLGIVKTNKFQKQLIFNEAHKEWRKKKALEATKKRRPDLLKGKYGDGSQP